MSCKDKKKQEGYLEITVGVQEKVRGLEVTMKDIGRMEGFESTKGLEDKLDENRERQRQTETDLVYKVLAMVVAELLGTDDTMEVSLHKLLNEIDLCELV